MRSPIFYAQAGLAFVLLSVVCSPLGAENLVQPLYGFVPVNYQHVTFDEIKSKPDEYAGKDVSVEGFLDRDYLVNDTEQASAFYDGLVLANGRLNKAVTTMSISHVYWDGLWHYGFPKKCTIYGAYVHTPNLMGKLHWIRIDHVESTDGSRLDLKFDVRGSS